MIKKKRYTLLGFEFPVSEIPRFRQACEDADQFMREFGKGAPARMNGEYYTPGTSPEDIDKKRKWLPEDAAMLYTGLDKDSLLKAVRKGIVERRLYRQEGRRRFFEYLISDLDRMLES